MKDLCNRICCVCGGIPEETYQGQGYCQRHYEEKMDLERQRLEEREQLNNEARSYDRGFRDSPDD